MSNSTLERVETIVLPLSELNTPKQVASYLSITVGALSNMRSARRGPRFLKHGGMVRYRREDLQEWLAAGVVGTIDQAPAA